MNYQNFSRFRLNQRIEDQHEPGRSNVINGPQQLFTRDGINFDTNRSAGLRAPLANDERNLNISTGQVRNRREIIPPNRLRSAQEPIFTTEMLCVRN